MAMTNPENRKIRILFPFIGDSVGGAQISGMALLENLDKTVYETIPVVHEEGPLTTFLKEKNIDFQILNLSAYLGRQSGILHHLATMLAITPKLVWFLLRNRIDIVHAQDSRMNLTWTFPAKLTRVPLVWHQRSGLSVSRLLVMGARLASHIVCISEYTLATLPAVLRSKASVVDNPVEIKGSLPGRKRSRTELCSALKIDLETPVIGFFGNLTEQKRPEIIIKVAAEINKKSVVDPVFVLFGADRDNLKADLLELTRALGVTSRVLFRNFVPDPERWMAGCDLIIAPGINEAFGRTVAEAMLVGTPVIASDSGGHKLIVSHGNTGLLVQADDVSAFAGAIESLWDKNGFSQSMSTKAASEASTRFLVSAHVAAISDIYLTVLNGKGGNVRG
jgi:glycosyltransferase involved in cell wall biosynthesis